jgi:hypothetical protein
MIGTGTLEFRVIRILKPAASFSLLLVGSTGRWLYPSIGCFLLTPLARGSSTTPLGNLLELNFAPSFYFSFR